MYNLTHADFRPIRNCQNHLGSSKNLNLSDILPNFSHLLTLWSIYIASNHNLSTTINAKCELMSRFLSLYHKYTKCSTQVWPIPLIMLSLCQHQFYTTLQVDILHNTRHLLIWYRICKRRFGNPCNKINIRFPLTIRNWHVYCHSQWNHSFLMRYIHKLEI